MGEKWTKTSVLAFLVLFVSRERNSFVLTSLYGGLGLFPDWFTVEWLQAIGTGFFLLFFGRRRDSIYILQEIRKKNRGEDAIVPSCPFAIAFNS